MDQGMIFTDNSNLFMGAKYYRPKSKIDYTNLQNQLKGEEN